MPPVRTSLNLDTQEGELIREGEGGSFSRSDEKDIYYHFFVLLPHILRIQHMILRARYINWIHSPFQTISKVKCKLV